METSLEDRICRTCDQWEEDSNGIVGTCNNFKVGPRDLPTKTSQDFVCQYWSDGEIDIDGRSVDREIDIDEESVGREIYVDKKPVDIKIEVQNPVTTPIKIRCYGCNKKTVKERITKGYCEKCYDKIYSLCPICKTEPFTLNSSSSHGECDLCGYRTDFVRCSNIFCRTSIYHKWIVDGLCKGCIETTNKCVKNGCDNRVKTEKEFSNGYRSYNGLCEPCYKKLRTISKIRTLFSKKK